MKNGDLSLKISSVEILRLCCYSVIGIWGGCQRESVGDRHSVNNTGIGQHLKELDTLRNKIMAATS